MAQYPGRERRKSKRIKLNMTLVYHRDAPLDVSVRSQDMERKAKMIDLGEGGLSIVTDIDIPVSTILWVRFTLSRMENKAVSYYGSMELLGEVRYCNPVEENAYRVGISFVNVKDKIKADIANFVISVGDNSDKK